MGRIGKKADKKEYEVQDTGEVKAKLLIGGKDETTGGKFVPNVNMSFECEHFERKEQFFLNMNFPVVVQLEQEQYDAGKDELTMSIGDYTFGWKIVPGRLPDVEVLKWDIILSVKPQKPMVFDLDWSDGMIFARHLSLEEQYNDFDDGCATLEEFLQTHGQAEGIAGGYAVYINKANHIILSDGKTTKVNYKTGKLCDIYRPKVTDALGDSIFADIDCDPNKKTLTITIPKQWLNKAAYPITVDPDVGYTSIGGSTITTDTRSVGNCRDAAGAVFVFGANPDKLISCSVYVSDESGSDWNKNSKTAVYDHSMFSNVHEYKIDGDSVEKTSGWVSPAWNTLALPGGGGHSEGEDCCPMWAWSSGVGTSHYDTLASARIGYKESSYTLADPYDGLGAGGYLYSLFCTYSETGAAVAPTAVLDGPLVGPLGGPI